MRIVDLGLTPYREAQGLQDKAVREVAAGAEGVVFLLEHPPVITFGRNGGEENLPFGREYFAAKGVEFVQASRGGNITCHFPGQLVAYPVLRVDKRPGGLRRFFHDLEETVIAALARFGLAAERVDGRPGVWVNGGKICSIGIAVKRWITCHGLALNVARDLALFDLVTPCGLAGVRATSLHRELGREDILMSQVKAALAEEFLRLFPEP